MQVKSYISLNKKIGVQFITMSVLMFVLMSCNKGPEFPNNPVIDYKGISRDVIYDTFEQLELDSVTVSINFQDGDGDLGVDLDDIDNVSYRSFSDTSVASNGDVSYSFVNYYIYMFKKQSGEFVKVVTFSRFGGSFRALVDYDQVGPIEGVLNYGFTLSESDLVFLDVFSNDTVRFEVYVVDRNLNVSNTITTDEIVLFEKE